MRYNIKKINLVYILIFTIVIGLSTTSFATSNKNDLISGEIDLSNLQSNFKVLSNYEMKGPFTFDELVDEMAKNEKITRDEATKRLAPETSESPLGTIQPYASVIYSTFVVRIDVTSSYSPSVNFYCKMNSINGIPTTFNEVLDVTMNRDYNGTSKIFGGDIYVNLESANTLYYRVNGDFYNNGTTTTSGGFKIGVGEEVNFNFNASYSTSHYKYHYSTGKIRR